MKKQEVKNSKNGNNLEEKSSNGIPYLILLLAYAFITVITPNLDALDSNGPKFLSLALINLLAFVFLLLNKGFNNKSSVVSAVFTHKIGILISLFLGIILVSFFVAINLPEAILTFSKYFTVFASAFILAIILKLHKKYFSLLATALSILLLIDCFTVLYNILLYISKDLASIYDIKSVYSNKNMLTSAIFVKIPFALWLATFTTSGLKKLGYLTVFLAVLSVLFMSTRTFYLGLIVLTILYIVFILLKERQYSTAVLYKKAGVFSGLMILAFVLFSLTQSYLFPKNTDAYNESFAQRLSTSVSGETSSALRLESWQRSVEMIKHNPILGVGAGNWKVRVLEYENPIRPEFQFMMKNHNDFLEVMTETGVIGGLLYIAIFVLIGLSFLLAFFKAGAEEKSYQYLFLPAFGLLCYTFDAFFNFPADRPEIQSLFALYLGISIAFSSDAEKEIKKEKTYISRIIGVVGIVLILGSVYVLYQNFLSLRLQTIIYKDLKSGNLNHASITFTDGFPAVPDIAVEGEPITISKARYLLEEGKFAQAISMMKNYKASPYDARKEVFLSLAYSKMGREDSALYYSIEANKLKPLHFTTLGFICNMLEKAGKKAEAQEKLQQYLNTQKYTKDAWIYMSLMYKAKGDNKSALNTLDSAVKYLPNDTAIVSRYTQLKNEVLILPYQETYAKALDLFNREKYKEALVYLNEIMAKEKGIVGVCSLRAMSNFYCNDLKGCIADVDRCAALGKATPDLICLRGICYHKSGNVTAACADFQDAMARGNKDAAINIEKFCKGK